MNTSYDYSTLHVITEHFMWLLNTSCDYWTGYVIIEYVMSLLYTSCHYWTRYVIIEHIMSLFIVIDWNLSIFIWDLSAIFEVSSLVLLPEKLLHGLDADVDWQEFPA